MIWKSRTPKLIVADPFEKLEWVFQRFHVIQGGMALLKASLRATCCPVTVYYMWHMRFPVKHIQALYSHNYQFTFSQYLATRQCHSGLTIHAIDVYHAYATQTFP